MYQIRLDKNEELFYLAELLNLAAAYKIMAVPVIMPVNTDRCRAYHGEEFDRMFDKNIAAVKNAVGKNAENIIDLSRILHAEYFNDDSTIDEACNYSGRVKVCAALAEYWRGKRGE